MDFRERYLKPANVGRLPDAGFVSPTNDFTLKILIIVIDYLQQYWMSHLTWKLQGKNSSCLKRRLYSKVRIISLLFTHLYKIPFAVTKHRTKAGGPWRKGENVSFSEKYLLQEEVSCRVNYCLSRLLSVGLSMGSLISCLDSGRTILDWFRLNRSLTWGRGERAL